MNQRISPDVRLVDKPPLGTINGMVVVARQVTDNDPEIDIVLVDRGITRDRWVTGCVRHDDPTPTEWFWGHYFTTLDDAEFDFYKRVTR